MTGRPLTYDSPEDLQKAITEYFEQVAEAKGIITVTGLALHLGFDSRQSIYDYKERDEFSYIIKRALLMVENAYEMRVCGNNPTGPIFVLKNMGWKDKSEVEQSGGLLINWHEEKSYQTKNNEA